MDIVLGWSSYQLIMKMFTEVIIQVKSGVIFS